MTEQVSLTEGEREALHERLASWFGDDRQAFLVSHLAPAVERILAARAAQHDCMLTDGRNGTWYSQDAVNELRADREAAEREQSEALADVMMWQERYTDLVERAAALVDEAEKVGHRGTCPVQPCDCWWSHGLYDAVNAATNALGVTECNAMGIKHEPHIWDFGSGEEFSCPGDPDGLQPPESQR